MDCFASLAMTMPDGWSEAIPINTTRAPMGIASLHPSYESRIRRRDLAARCARSFAFRLPSQKSEGAGKTGCALHPRSRVHDAQRNAHTSIQVQRRTPGLPCAMALRLIRVRPGDRLSCHHRRQRLSPLLDLTPAPGRQAHTISPYATAAFVFAAFASTAPRPSFATMANAPLTERDGRICKRDSTCRQSGM